MTSASCPNDTIKKMSRLATLRVLMATLRQSQHHPKWPAEVKRLELQFAIDGQGPPPDLIQQWQERCTLLDASPNPRTFNARQAEIAVLKWLMKAPWLRQRPLSAPTDTTISVPSSNPSRSNGPSGSSNSVTPISPTSTSRQPSQHHNLPPSRPAFDEGETPAYTTAAARHTHTTANDQGPPTRSTAHSAAGGVVESHPTVHDNEPQDDLSPATLDSERHTFLSRSNAMPISVGHGAKQGMVLVYPDDLQLDDNLERKPFGWRGSGWARVLQDGMDQEVFVDVVVSIPRGARGYTPHGEDRASSSQSGSGVRGSGTGSSSSLRDRHRNEPNTGEGSTRYGENSTTHNEHTRNHGHNEFGRNDNSDREYKPEGGKCKRGDGQGGAVKRGRYGDA